MFARDALDRLGVMFHALLIGVDAYVPNRLPNQGTYASLGGCVRDVQQVEAMLRARVPDAPAITMLLAPRDAAGMPVGDPASWPTAANIRGALARVVECARPGDQVYVHYSGHGGRVATVWEDLKGPGGVDEGLVPMDIGLADAPGAGIETRPERYIRDVELVGVLERLAGKVDDAGRRVTVTLVLDCCHSGGALRGVSDVAPRTATGGRAAAGDPYGTLDAGRVADGHFTAAWLADMAEAYRRRRPAPTAAPGTRSMSVPFVSWLPPADSYVLLAACRDVEAALECSIDGRPRAGVLTSAFLEALTALGTDQSWKTLYDRVLTRVRGLFAAQTPQLVGAAGRSVFGVELLPTPTTLLVSAVDAAARTVTVDGGLALAITDGTELGIYAPGVTDFSPARRLAGATVSNAAAFQSVAALAAGADPGAIRIGAPAVVESLPLRRRVALLERAGLPAATALASLRAALAATARGFIELATAAATPHYHVAITDDDHYEVLDPGGTPFAGLPPVRLDADHAAELVVQQLRRLARYHTVLAMNEPTSFLRNQIGIELLRAPPGWTADKPTAPVGGTPLEPDGDLYTVETDTWLWLRLTNRAPTSPVNAALLNLSRTWEIEMVAPHDLRYETVADQPRTFAFGMSSPGVAETNDVLKLFLAIGDVDFPSLTTNRAAVAGGQLRGAPSTVLGQVIDELTADRRAVRAVLPMHSPRAPWTVHNFRIRTVNGTAAA